MLATGAELTVTTKIFVEVELAFLATNVIVSLPLAEKATFGFLSVEVEGLPFWKVQLHEVGVPLLVSVIARESPVQTEEAHLNPATSLDTAL